MTVVENKEAVQEEEERLTPEKVAQLYQVIPYMTDEQKRSAHAKIKIFQKIGRAHV